MTTPATLLDDAFDEAIAYWRANNGGTRAGLITDLVSVIGISVGVATAWTDVFTAETFKLGKSSDITYAAFKTWLLSVGSARAEAGIRSMFDSLKTGVLLNDARRQLIEKLNDGITITDTRIVNISLAISEIEAQVPSTSRTLILKALDLYLSSSRTRRNRLTIERARLAVLVTG